MITVKEKLMAQADTQAERDLIAVWMEDDPERLCARQRSWEELDRRLGRGELRFGW